MKAPDLPMLDTGAPPPLAPLTHTVISPANIAAQQRERQAIRLTLGKRIRYKLDKYNLRVYLQREKYNEVQQELKRLRAEVQSFKQQYQQAAPDQRDQLKQRGYTLSHQYRTAKDKYQVLLPYASKLAEITNLEEEHHIAVQRDQLQKKLFAAMEAESKIYEQILIARLTQLGFCHRYTYKGRERVDKIRFVQVSITVDAIYYEIDASYQTAFKNWKTKLPQGVRLTDIAKSEIQMELSVSCKRQVRFVISARGAFIIVDRLESPDGLMEYVSFTDVMKRYPVQYNNRMPICVGVGNNRQIQWINLADYPHWLIGGFTFSGKSNMVNVGLCTLITRQSPQELRLILIDLKGGLEFNYYDRIPHLLGGIVESVEGIAGRLAQVEAIMYQRFKEIKGVAKRIEEYQIKRPNAKMPRILIVFDEVASMTNHGALTQRINASLREITRMGRAVGIHIWFCTQRPDVSAIDGSIKANLALRLSGRMTTSADSVTVLGNSMAKDIAPIKGRMALQLGPDPSQVQTPHLDEDNLLEAVEQAKKYPVPTDDDLPLPDENASIHQIWTPERVIELSLTHLGGNITAKRVYEAAKDDGLTQAQARALVETVWKMKIVEFDGKRYAVKPGRSNTKSLIEIEDIENQPISIPEPTT